MPRPSAHPHRDRVVAATAGAAAVAALWFGPALGRAVPTPAEVPQAASVSRPLAAGAPGVPGVPDPSVPVPAVPGPEAGSVPGTSSGPPVPAVVFAAYKRAEGALATRAAACHLTWPLLAAVGHVESSHARGGRVDATGRTLSPILGPVLDGGGGTAAIDDSEQGRLDGDASWDRAVGPMQFIPTTWASSGVDGSGDGVADPHNVVDAAQAAALENLDQERRCSHAPGNV